MEVGQTISVWILLSRSAPVLMSLISLLMISVLATALYHYNHKRLFIVYKKKYVNFLLIFLASLNILYLYISIKWLNKALGNVIGSDDIFWNCFEIGIWLFIALSSLKLYLGIKTANNFLDLRSKLREDNNHEKLLFFRDILSLDQKKFLALLSFLLFVIVWLTIFIMVLLDKTTYLENMTHILLKLKV